MKKTKIICSIGPSTNKRDVFKRLVHAGMNVARVNFSHATIEERETVHDLVSWINEEESVVVSTEVERSSLFVSFNSQPQNNIAIIKHIIMDDNVLVFLIILTIICVSFVPC